MLTEKIAIVAKKKKIVTKKEIIIALQLNITILNGNCWLR